VTEIARNLLFLRLLCLDPPFTLHGPERGGPAISGMGRRSLPLIQSGGLDIDHGYGIAMTEYWLRSHGFSEHTTPYGRSS